MDTLALRHPKRWVAAAGREEGRCRIEPRGFWVDKSVVDKEERPRERGRAEEKKLERVPQDERPERVRAPAWGEGVSLQGLNLSRSFRQAGMKRPRPQSAKHHYACRPTQNYLKHYQVFGCFALFFNSFAQFLTVNFVDSNITSQSQTVRCT